MSKVHKELCASLDRRGVRQIIYSAFAEKQRLGANRFEAERTTFVYSPIIKPFHRYLYLWKTMRVCVDVLRKVCLKEVDCIHASNLFSDGGVAYLLHLLRGTPYIISVRTTDLKVFLNRKPYLRFFAYRVIKHAEKVLFITPALKETMVRHKCFVKLSGVIEDKSLIIPNGIDDFWHAHLRPEGGAQSHNVAYVGRFDINKNVSRLVRAVLDLIPEIPDIRLNLVGGDGEQHSEILAQCEADPVHFRYLGKIHEKDLLMDFYRDNAIFAMISRAETFGLVYVEALSQGLPVLYTRGQGIDGLFPQHIGEAVNPFRQEEITGALRTLLLSPGNYEHLDAEVFRDFEWDVIAAKYQQMYQEIICH